MSLHDEWGVVDQNDLELLASLERLLLQFEVRDFFLDRVSLVVCCKASVIEKAHITNIRKAKEPTWMVENAWSLPYFAQMNA